MRQQAAEGALKLTAVPARTGSCARVSALRPPMALLGRLSGMFKKGGSQPSSPAPGAASTPKARLPQGPLRGVARHGARVPCASPRPRWLAFRRIPCPARRQNTAVSGAWHRNCAARALWLGLFARGTLWRLAGAPHFRARALSASQHRSRSRAAMRLVLSTPIHAASDAFAAPRLGPHHLFLRRRQAARLPPRAARLPRSLARWSLSSRHAPLLTRLVTGQAFAS